LFRELDAEGKTPVYYGGGSELISMARLGSLSFGAVIDIKSIPECRVCGCDDKRLHLGGAVTLSEIGESGLFPLLGSTAGRIADHTMQCRITLGGNLCSAIIYREAVLPLLLADASLTVAESDGLKEYRVHDIFRERLLLPKGACFVKAAVDKRFLKLPYFHVKKTKNEKIDYPLLTAAGLKADGFLRLAFSGLASYPFRSTDAEAVLNDAALQFDQRAQRIAELLSGVLLEDLSGSAEYRKFVLKNTVVQMLETMGEE
jgi:CO/xanthine dehydrogenase FAD-binding subunit